MRSDRGVVLILIFTCLSAREAAASAKIVSRQLMEPRAAATCSEPAFGSPVTHAVGDTPYTMVAADFDHDGHLDLAVANWEPSISVLFGTGDGDFRPPTTLPVPVDTIPVSLTTSDFNNDGNADLAFALAHATLPDGRVMVLLGDGHGSFAGSSIDMGEFLSAVVTADFDSDGKADLAVTNYPDRTVSLRRGNGAGSFGPRTTFPLPGPGNPEFMAVGDFDGDGRTDLAVTTVEPWPGPGTVEVLLGDGAGGFASAGSLPFARPTNVATADVNGDARVDLIVTNIPEDRTQSHVSVRLGDGAGGFGPPVTFPVPGIPVSALTADVNGDGLVDLAVANTRLLPNDHSRGVFEVLLGDGAGGFGPPKGFSTLAIIPGMGAAIGDFDEDGRIDLAAAIVGERISVLPNFCGNVADLAVTMHDSPDPARRGGRITYTVQVESRGPDRAGVRLETTVPAGALVESTGASRGSCDWLGSNSVMTCELGNFEGPGDTATFTMVVTADSTGTFGSTSTVVNSVVESNPDDNSASETTRVLALGGYGLRITAAPGGAAELTWAAGESQAGYFVGRLAGGATTIFPAGGPLPASATSFTDPSPMAGQANCYAVAPVDALGTAYALSDLVCLIPNTASPSAAPTNFSLQLSQSTTARFTWSAPGGQSAYILAAYPLDGSPVRGVGLGPSATFATFTADVPTCYVLVTVVGAVQAGHSDVLCAVPGVATLPP